MAETPGEQIDQYRLIAPIGRGGFATVYRALDERLDSTVAMKILAENHALDGDIRERFLSEAQLLRRVECPEIVTVHDVGETARRQPYMVLTYAGGGDLRNRAGDGRGRQPVGEPDLLMVADTLAAALRKVHGAGIVHRDVKPDNLLIDSSAVVEAPAGGGLLAEGERLLLGDLGYAKDLIASSGLTVGGGTQGFNAPEQRIGLNTVDQRADVFGASALLFWLLTGEPPPLTEAETQAAVAGLACSAPVQSALRVGLVHDVQGRFPNIDTWHRALAPARPAGHMPQAVVPPAGAPALSNTVPTRLAAPDSTPPSAGSAATRNRGRGLAAVAAAIGLVVGLLVASVGWSFLGGDRVTVTQLDDGRTSVQRQQGDLRLAVFGPSSVQVGEQAVFEAAATGATSISWINADGSIVASEERLVLVARQLGEGRVTLLATDVEGRTETVEFEFEVIG